ncbi:hypothetical protein F751_1756 [Auxenochlorella protothecoides]|uniref:PI3K/PI4K catalytic domain-containing protein n=1 Tax=Auxenochlorella protothecoides TaxID=3075 RepID=A0A087SGM3_AUXPR|nr:hypothetical protein F751_1756 [Auxenochlorella protothecoides]KFM24877.1 hypothetical protein F751_1756 [Auxenochlorella protothecoides]
MLVRCPELVEAPPRWPRPGTLYTEADQGVPRELGVGLPATACQFCAECSLAGGGGSLTTAPEGAPPLALHNATHSSAWTPLGITVFNRRAGLPNCTTCTGCSHHLEQLGGRLTFDRVDLPNRYTGALMPDYTLLASQPQLPGAEEAEPKIARLLCVDLHRNGQWARHECTPTDRAARQHRQMVALARLVDECGLAHVVPRHTVANITVLLPQSGYVQSREALLSDRAKGIPLQLLQGSWHWPAYQLQDIWRRIPSEHVVQAAIFDLLVGHCDRHPDNVFVTDDGRMTLIDNDQIQGNIPGCLYESFFLPRCTKHEILINGFGWATQRHFQKNVLPDVRPSPLAFFDYRCHAAGGAVGTAFPGALPTCLAKLGGKDGLRNALDLGFSRRHAEHLAARAALLVEQGLEGAIASLAEARPAADRIPLQPACCAVNSQGFCATEFRPDLGNGTLREPTQRSLLYHYGAVALFGGALASGFAYFAIYRPVRGLVRHTAPEEAVLPPRS